MPVVLVVLVALLQVCVQDGETTPHQNVNGRNTGARRFFLAEGRIVNGEFAERHEFPWMAMITDQSGFQFCGATLINSRYVLTAGHCMLGKKANKIRIRLGAHNKTDFDDPDVEVRTVRKVIRHPDYKPIFQHDFCLLELDEEVSFNEAIRPICLPPLGNDFNGEKATVTGWGRISSGGADSQVLQKATVPVMDQKVCAKRYNPSGSGSVQVLDDMLCAGGNGKDACQRDSGGPLIWQNATSHRWHLIGVVSWGDECGSPYYPGVYARVSDPVADAWIRRTVGDLKCE